MEGWEVLFFNDLCGGKKMVLWKRKYNEQWKDTMA
jgi:hypothetical protein